MSYPFVALVLFSIPILMYLLAFRHPLRHANLLSNIAARCVVHELIPSKLGAYPTFIMLSAINSSLCIIPVISCKNVIHFLQKYFSIYPKVHKNVV